MKSSFRRLLHHRAFWIILLTGLFTISLATRIDPYPDHQWRWHNRPPAPSTFSRWWPSLLALAVFVLLGFWLDRKPSRRQVWSALAFLVLAAPLIQVCLVYIQNEVPVVSYLHRTIGPHNGFWQVAIGKDDIIQYLRDYPAEMQAHPFVHLMVHPPGNIVYVWLWRRAFQALPGLAATVAHYLRFYNCGDLSFVNLDNDQIASALAQMVIPLLSGLTVIPLYLLGRRLNDPRTALRAAALYVIVPSFTLFTMRWDQLYPLFFCFALYWLHLGLEKRRASLYFLSGLTISVASFMSFGNLTIFPAAILYGLVYLVSTGLENWRCWPAQTWGGWVLFVLGGASIWLIYHAISGNSFLDVFSTAMQAHYNLGRIYWIWVLFNPYDFLTFLGVPVAVLFVAAGWRAWKRALLSRGRDVPLGSILALTIAGAMVALNISGVARGEVGRMWLLWMPAACLIGAASLQGLTGRRLYRLALVLMAFQALMFTLFLRVAATGLPAYDPHEPRTERPSVGQRVDARFGEDIALLGFDLNADRVTPGDALRLKLYWQALDRPDLPYTVFAHLFDADGQLRGQQDGMPKRGELPTTCWVPGEYVSDRHDILVPADTPPGEYRLEVGLYWLRTGERLPASGLDAAFPDRVLLGSVEVVEDSP